MQWEEKQRAEKGPVYSTWILKEFFLCLFLMLQKCNSTIIMCCINLSLTQKDLQYLPKNAKEEQSYSYHIYKQQYGTKRGCQSRRNAFLINSSSF